MLVDGILIDLTSPSTPDHTGWVIGTPAVDLHIWSCGGWEQPKGYYSTRMDIHASKIMRLLVKDGTGFRN